ncbi:unnamed protein product [Closterium sp. NIES-54]
MLTHTASSPLIVPPLLPTFPSLPPLLLETETFRVLSASSCPPSSFPPPTSLFSPFSPCPPHPLSRNGTDESTWNQRRVVVTTSRPFTVRSGCTIIAATSASTSSPSTSATSVHSTPPGFALFSLPLDDPLALCFFPPLAPPSTPPTTLSPTSFLFTVSSATALPSPSSSAAAPDVAPSPPTPPSSPPSSFPTPSAFPSLPPFPPSSSFPFSCSFSPSPSAPPSSPSPPFPTPPLMNPPSGAGRAPPSRCTASSTAAALVPVSSAVAPAVAAADSAAASVLASAMASSTAAAPPLMAPWGPEARSVAVAVVEEKHGLTRRRMRREVSMRSNCHTA